MKLRLAAGRRVRRLFFMVLVGYLALKIKKRRENFPGRFSVFTLLFFFLLLLLLLPLLLLLL
jgi:hypothetical protein